MAFSAEDIFSFASSDPSKPMQGLFGSKECTASPQRGADAQPPGDAYVRMKTAAEEATRTVESTMKSAQAGTMAFGIQAIEAMRTSAQLSLSHLEALMGVTSVSELVELQTAFMRRQAEITVEQASAMQESARKLAETMARPATPAADRET